METPEMRIVQPGEPAAENKQPTIEEIRKEFAEMLEKPIDAGEIEEAKTQLLVCDIQIAQLDQAIAALEAQIATNKAERAKSELAKAIIARRLANK